MASLKGRVDRLTDRLHRTDRDGGAPCTRCGGLHAITWMRRADPGTLSCTCACCPFLAALGEFGRGQMGGGLR